MKITITIDDDLYKSALEFAGLTVDKLDIFQEALKIFIQAQTTNRLAAFGGAKPGMNGISHRREK